MNRFILRNFRMRKFMKKRNLTWTILEAAKLVKLFWVAISFRSMRQRFLADTVPVLTSWYAITMEIHPTFLSRLAPRASYCGGLTNAFPCLSDYVASEKLIVRKISSYCV